MSRRTDNLKAAAAVLVLGCVTYFFYRAFQRNWASVEAQDFELHYGYLACAVLCVYVTYLVPTRAWQLSLNAHAQGQPLSFKQSFAVVNASGLTKYIPGKVWSYALQMYWLADMGFSKSVVAYVNGINLFISLVASFMVGLAMLLPVTEVFPPALTGAALAALVVIDLLALGFHDVALRWLVQLNNRHRKRQMQYFSTSGKLLVKLHVLHLIAAFAFALTAYFTCLGIGTRVPLARAPHMMAALLLADTAAVVAIVVPSGLGVREGLMYALLGGATAGAIALTLPVATRVIHMFSDLTLGALAITLLRRLNLRTAKS